MANRYQFEKKMTHQIEEILLTGVRSSVVHPPISLRRSPPPSSRPNPSTQAPPLSSSSPEKLDWGSIDEEDGAYAVKPSLHEAVTPTSATPVQQAAIPELLQETQVTFQTSLSPLQILSSVEPPPKTATKVKSVLVIPDGHYEAKQSRSLNGGALQKGCDTALDCQVVKSKRHARPAGHSSLAGPSKQQQGRGVQILPRSQPSSEYKNWFKGRCFWCLSKDHLRLAAAAIHLVASTALVVVTLPVVAKRRWTRGALPLSVPASRNLTSAPVSLSLRGRFIAASPFRSCPTLLLPPPSHLELT
jgi:hypothetical protein